jgi:CheY-like chemotaxis protein
MTTVLLVEDNAMNRDMLSRRLAMRGLQVICATDGGEALRLARDSRPDIVLMDLNLPVVDGWEVARRLKNDPLTVSIPVLALTAYGTRAERQLAIDAGCDEYETKPIDLPRLLAKIVALVGRGDELPQQ